MFPFLLLKEVSVTVISSPISCYLSMMTALASFNILYLLKNSASFTINLP